MLLYTGKKSIIASNEERYWRSVGLTVTSSKIVVFGKITKK
jgi:hypothetical protein